MAARCSYRKNIAGYGKNLNSWFCMLELGFYFIFVFLFVFRVFSGVKMGLHGLKTF